MEAWVEALRKECTRIGQTRAGRSIGYSSTVINRVLKGTYAGDLQAVRKAVEGALMGSKVDCPVLGELAANQCLNFQGMDFAATTPQRVALYRACRSGCTHSRLAKDETLAGRV